MYKSHTQYLEQRKEVSDIIQSIKKINTPSKKLNLLSSKLPYVKLFSKLGVQGLVGLLEVKKSKLPVVFKVSAIDDKCIDLEYSVLEALQTIRPFCPHFMGVYHLSELPVSKGFILDNIDDNSKHSDKHDDETHSEDEMSDHSESSSSSKTLNLYSYDDDIAYNLKNVLFLEYVSDYDLKHVIKYCDKSVLYSQVISVLCGLYTAQRHIEFTHYDLHIHNVMIKLIEPESYFVYNLGSDSFIIPTFGLYPVIIDMGNGYCKQLEGQVMKSTPRWCGLGSLSMFYDRFNDIHHFLLNLFTYIEQETEEYYFLSTRIMWFFRFLRVYRESGWKLLPMDVFRDTRNYIRENCPELYEWRSYRSFDKRFIEILSLGITLPWKEHLDQEIVNEYNSQTEQKEMFVFALKHYFVEFFRSFDVIYKIDKGDDIEYILKELVDIVYIHKPNIKKNMDKVMVKKIWVEWMKRIECCGIEIPSVSDGQIDYGRMFYNCKMSFSILSSMYFQRIIPSIEYINESYSKLEVKSAIDFIKLLKQNTGVRYEYSRQTILYVWNTVDKTSKKVMLNSLIPNVEVDKLNLLNPSRSELKILQLLKFK
jgi:hypothetical protein